MATDQTEIDVQWMQQALALARQAEAMGEVPVGAVVVREADQQLLGQGHNRVIVDQDPTAHAEVVALRQAAAEVGNYRLPDCTLYVTLEPCAMCAGALVNARLRRVVYGASDPRAGAGGSVFQVLDQQVLNHRCGLVGGVEAEAAAALLVGFFKARRGQHSG
jgi:tRNA(adenine34) deaminase